MVRAVKGGSVLLGIGIALVIITFSCAYERNELAVEPYEKGCTHADVQDAISSARHDVANRDYQKALEILNNTCAKTRKDGALQISYARIIEDIKNDAESAFENKRFAEAGKIYNVLLRDGFRTTDFAAAASFDREFLKNRIKTCARILSDSGLKKYRKGEFDEAISIWEKVLTFDPDNIEVKKAFNTARNQLRNLNKIQ